MLFVFRSILWEAWIHILCTVFLAHVVHLHILLMHFKDISVLFGLILFWDIYPREIISYRKLFMYKGGHYGIIHNNVK